MIKIRLKLLDLNTSGRLTKAPKPNRDSDGENVIISDTITPHDPSYKQSPFSSKTNFIIVENRAFKLQVQI